MWKRKNHKPENVCMPGQQTSSYSKLLTTYSYSKPAPLHPCRPLEAPPPRQLTLRMHTGMPRSGGRNPREPGGWRQAFNHDVECPSNRQVGSARSAATAPSRCSDCNGLSGWVAESDTAAVEALRLSLLRAAAEADGDADDDADDDDRGGCFYRRESSSCMGSSPFKSPWLVLIYHRP